MLHACQSCHQIEEIGPGSGPNDGRRDSCSRDSSALCHCVGMVAENGSKTMSCRYSRLIFVWPKSQGCELRYSRMMDCSCCEWPFGQLASAFNFQGRTWLAMSGHGSWWQIHFQGIYVHSMYLYTEVLHVL